MEEENQALIASFREIRLRTARVKQDYELCAVLFAFLRLGMVSHHRL